MRSPCRMEQSCRGGAQTRPSHRLNLPWPVLARPLRQQDHILVAVAARIGSVAMCSAVALRAGRRICGGRARCAPVCAPVCAHLCAPACVCACTRGGVCVRVRRGCVHARGSTPRRHAQAAEAAPRSPFSARHAPGADPDWPGRLSTCSTDSIPASPPCRNAKSAL